MRAVINALWLVFAPNVIAGFFHRERDQLVTARGAEVLADPALRQQVEDALAKHRSERNPGPVVVRFNNPIP